MEFQDILDATNEVHLFSLHYVFLGRINYALQEFSAGWNSYGIRTEHGMTPNQLFIAGVLRLRQMNLTAFNFFNSVGDNYGIEADDTIDGDEEGVSIPHSVNRPTIKGFTVTNKSSKKWW